MTCGAISKVLGKLGAKGLVARAAHPQDSRVQWLSLTRKSGLPSAICWKGDGVPSASRRARGITAIFSPHRPLDWRTATGEANNNGYDLNDLAAAPEGPISGWVTAIPRPWLSKAALH